MIVNNVKVYGLEESIKRAKYPMSTDVNQIIEPQEMKYWMQDNFLAKFIQHQAQSKYPKYQVLEDCVSMELIKENGETVNIFLDEEDIPVVFDKDWHFDKYCRSNEVGLLHRYILKNELKDNDDLVIDHINRNTADNRKSNLRLATKTENGYNSKTRKNNNSGVMGVCWNSDKNKWRAYLNIRGKQIHIGYYNSFDEAVIARLKKEGEVCGEFAPQKELFAQYGISTHESHPTIIKTFCHLNDAIAAYKNIVRLGNANKGTGHDQALTGVIVQFDLTFTVKAWTEAERYHFLDFVSSQSTMHRITRFNLDEAYSEYVDSRIIEIMKEKVNEYNALSDYALSITDNTDAIIEDKKRRYLEILYSNPCGFKLTAGMTTNYRQLKTIYHQRKAHRLPEWKEFCEWIETLPLFKEMCLGGN